MMPKSNVRVKFQARYPELSAHLNPPSCSQFPLWQSSSSIQVWLSANFSLQVKSTEHNAVMQSSSSMQLSPTAFLSLHVKSTEQNPLSQPVSKAHVAPFALAPLVPTTNKVRRVAINSFIVRLENWVWQTKRSYESDSVQSFGSCLVRGRSLPILIRILPVFV